MFSQPSMPPVEPPKPAPVVPASVVRSSEQTKLKKKMSDPRRVSKSKTIMGNSTRYGSLMASIAQPTLYGG